MCGPFRGWRHFVQAARARVQGIQREARQDGGTSRPMLGPVWHDLSTWRSTPFRQPSAVLGIWLGIQAIISRRDDVSTWRSLLALGHLVGIQAIISRRDSDAVFGLGLEGWGAVWLNHGFLRSSPSPMYGIAKASLTSSSIPPSSQNKGGPTRALLRPIWTLFLGWGWWRRGCLRFHEYMHGPRLSWGDPSWGYNPKSTTEPTDLVLLWKRPVIDMDGRGNAYLHVSVRGFQRRGQHFLSGYGSTSSKLLCHICDLKPSLER